jgi:hypothetical protein
MGSTATQDSIHQNDVFILDVQYFYSKGPHSLLWPGSRAARGKITSGIPNHLSYCVIFIEYNLQMWPRDE